MTWIVEPFVPDTTVIQNIGGCFAGSDAAGTHL